MKQSTYLCVILHVKHKKLAIVSVFTTFQFLGKIQDGDNFWGRHRPPSAPPPIKYSSSCWEDERLFNMTQNLFEVLQYIKNLRERFERRQPPTPNHPFPPPFVKRWAVRVWLASLYLLAYFGKEMLRNNNGFSRLFFSHCVKNINRSFSVTWSAALQISWNNRKF